MQAFTTSHLDTLTAAAAGVLFNEDLSSVKEKVAKLKVGNMTNFGLVKSITDTSVEFKARDTGVTKIALNARKLGSKDFVLDQLIKITKEEVELDEAAISSKTAAFIKFINDNSESNSLLAAAFDDIATAADKITKERAGGIGGLSVSETLWKGVGDKLRKVASSFKKYDRS